mmetsp:Transcript_33998/g.89241  ORF Transcript_33998/g.89241 Transcript_33998/m.89241 type:complete len:291 (+) Transcript_33998:529-1401(+)
MVPDSLGARPLGLPLGLGLVPEGLGLLPCRPSGVPRGGLDRLGFILRRFGLLLEAEPPGALLWIEYSLPLAGGRGVAALADRRVGLGLGGRLGFGLDPLVGLEALHKGIHVDPYSVALALARDRGLAVVDPALGGKVRRLGTVEAMVEAGVKRPGERDHELTGAVNRLVARDAVVPQHLGRDHGHLVPEELAALGMGTREELCRQALHPGSVVGRDAVPRLRRAVVDVVDRIQIHVLGVPAERRLPHPKVQVRSVDAFNLRPVTVVSNQVQDGPKSVDVPDAALGVGESP